MRKGIKRELRDGNPAREPIQYPQDLWPKPSPCNGPGPLATGKRVGSASETTAYAASAPSNRLSRRPFPRRYVVRRNRIPERVVGFVPASVKSDFRGVPLPLPAFILLHNTHFYITFTNIKVANQACQHGSIMTAECSGAGGLSLMADLISSAGGPAVAIAAVQAHIADSGGDAVPDATELDGSRRVAIACNECVRAKMRCSNERPCERCVRRACEHLCVDRPSRVAMIAPTPAVVIQTAVRRKRSRPIPYKPCNLCSKVNALCDLQRPCGRCVKLNERIACTDVTSNDVGSETESDDGEILQEVMGGRPSFSITSTNTIISPIPTLPAVDPYTKTRALFTPTLASPRSSPPPRSMSSPAPQSFVPFNDRPLLNSGQSRNNRLLRGKPPFMVRSPLQFPLKLALQWRFAYKQYPAAVLGPLLLSPTRMQHFMSNSLDVITREECIAMRIEMIIAACESESSLSSQLIPLCTVPYNPIPFKTQCIALVLDSSIATHEPVLTIGDDDLLRIAFWESPCPVLRLGMSYEHSEKTEISLSLNTEAQRILGFSSHAELDQLHQDFAKATSCPMSIPLLWRFFSQRSLHALGMAQHERDFRNLTQFRVDLELIANNGLHIPCRTYWKYRMLPNGHVNDILIAIKRIL